MRRIMLNKITLIILFLALAVSTRAQTNAQTPTFKGTNTVTSQTVTPSTAIGTCDTLIEINNLNTISASSTFADNKSNTFTPINSIANSGAGISAAEQVVKCSASGSTTSTFGTSPSTSTNLQSIIYDITGLNTTNPVDQSNQNQGNGTTMTTGALVTTGTRMLIASFFSQAGSMCSSISGWTIDGSTGSPHSFGQTFYILSAAAGTYNPSCTDATGNWVAMIVSLNPTGAGTGAKRRRVTISKLYQENHDSSLRIAESAAFVIPKKRKRQSLEIL